MNLYPFQQANVEQFIGQTNVLCADEMGLGKTVTAIALDLERRKTETGKTLIVAPLSVLNVWETHYRDWAPQLKVSTIDPKNRENFLTQDADVYVCHWQSLTRLPGLAKRKWLHVIADEVHRAKNRKAQQTQALKKIRTSYKTGLTGTPAEDKPQDIWSILNWLYPQDFRSYWKFYNAYLLWDMHPKGKYRLITGVQNTEELRTRIKPYYTRSLKKNVLKELPDKTYSTIHVKLTPSQRKAYEQMRKTMLAWVGENEDKPLAAPAVISRLMRLQQFAIGSINIVDGFKMVKVTEENVRAINKFNEGTYEIGDKIKVATKIVRMVEPSSKLDAVMQKLEDNPDASFVVFSQFKQVANLLAERCRSAKISYGLYTGDTEKQDRDNIVSDFQAGKRQVFIGTIRAGGEGITLHRSSTVIFIDRDWTSSKNSQAEDRVHRAGQKNAVQIIDIVATGTIDGGRHQKIALKAGMIRQLLGE